MADTNRIGYYDIIIRWGILDIDARASGVGYWDRRTPQNNQRVEAYELKINPNNESYYLPSPEGGFVQFENLIGNTVQDGKLILNPGSSWYCPSQLPERMQSVARGNVLAEAGRQIAAAHLHSLEVEWLMSDQTAIDEIRDLFRVESINVRLRFLAE